jgi:hypothetical protein
MKYPHYLFVFSVVTMASCHLSKSTSTVQDNTTQWSPWVIKYERGPCFGECPVYVFYLLTDHTGLIEVKHNLLEPGWYHAPLDQEAIHQILADIEPESLWNEDLSGQPEIADLPTASIVYKHKDGLRWMSVQGKISDQVADVFQKVNHLVTEARWTPSALRPFQPTLPEPTDVIVQLKEDVDIQEWMKKYEHFGIKLKKRLSPQQQYFVVTKDPGMGAANDFLQYIKLDPEVVGAQWDNPVTQRGQ